ncbi:hypothetical protein BKG89_07840 [Rodentibacter caecimuris]|uniref:Heptosyltransferase n=1 Tax=Rodentibacter caecimuris TaxID=1796644 RepID=A0ABX3KW01_9PAST|nr:hypothetical protein BKG89_07840 [Rodentibacter heylii]
MPPHSILIRPLGNAIGDATVHTAHIQQLRTAFPEAKIGVIVTPQNRAIFEHCRLVDCYVERNLLSYIKNHKKWDWLLDFENNFNSASLFMDRILIPNSIIIFRKYNKKHYNFNRVKNYDLHYPQQDNTPLSHYLSNSSLATLFNLPQPYSVLHIHAEDQHKISCFWQPNKIRLLLCPQGSKRQIPEDELAELLNHSIPPSTQIELILGYTKLAEKYCQKLTALCPQLQIKCSPKTTLSGYLALIKSAYIIIAVDGGSLHLSCAFKKPLLSFFADSQPNLGTWQPLIAANVSHLRIISRTPGNSNDTQDFPLDSAINWLKKEIKKQEQKRY